ncbi:hypothetical protein AB9F29_18360 [Falsihalocynthiibacter sp. S25ZX9]|uniref:hypothetical protein n=1 Tax=unclassified Falsihalocynthiibacter TaxID=2854191 RepID=UPI003510CF5F
MITRFAMFEGTIHAGKTDAFRAAIMDELLPKWQAFPGARAVRVTFTEEADPGAPEFPLIMEIDYDDLTAVTTALNSPARTEGKKATEALLPRFFKGRIHHHVATKAC